MQTAETVFCGLPAVRYGAPSERCFLFVHGKFGSRLDAAPFAEAADRCGWQTLAVDLPGHGLRSPGEPVPWEAVPELQSAARELARLWTTVGFAGVSIGAWLGLTALDGRNAPEPARRILISPVADMETLILGMMAASGVSEERLKREGEIPTAFGETLSWRYLTWVREHRIPPRPVPTDLIAGGRDEMMGREAFFALSEKLGASLTLLENSRHWIHTPDELDILKRVVRFRLGRD